MGGVDETVDGASPDDGPTPAPGWWPSPWTAARTAAGKVSRSGLQADGPTVSWCESRPEDGGGQVVVGYRRGSAPVDLSPAGVSVRSRVHEYGGGGATLQDGVLLYVDQSDQQWYRFDCAGGPAARRDPVALTGAAPGDVAGGGEGADGWRCRYADGRMTRSGSWLLSVEERHRGAVTDHRLVAVPVPPGETVTGPAPVVSLVDDRDFVAAPRPSPDGRWVAWLTWDHPAMPWDRSELWAARLEEAGDDIRLHDRRRVAGGGSSVGQPRWGRDGGLLFVDDRTGWWLPYRLPPDGLDRAGVAAQPLVDLEAEFHSPDWVLGQSTMAERSDGSLVCRMHRDGRDQVVHLRADATAGTGTGSAPWSMEVIDQPCVAIAGLAIATDPSPAPGPAVPGERLYVLGSTTVEAQAVVEIPWSAGAPVRTVSAGAAAPVDEAGVAEARPFTASTRDGPVPGLFYAPVGAPHGAPTGPPPLVLFCHGGPTSAAEGGLDPVVQFFASRGLAVAAVNYRGSSGFGRAYRRRLEGQWGLADVDDCVHYASALARAGLVDGGRMAIRGTSAGGLTALGALIRSDRFAGAATWYGVTDLEALAADTHDFESRYLDSLVGPWPGARRTYRSRSPIHAASRVTGSVLLLQGVDDPVVPPDQSRRFAALLEERGVPCRLVLFEGESHGFRRAETIEASLRAELEFYRSLFAPPVEPTAGEPVS